ncbi:NAD/NADP octopine/nopaline dehydrogenase family protein [Aminobacterium sp. MB27-C1]|jgi:opine dehydrogenase|nr:MULTISPECIES: NAD/NADP-dependent octopine/nopaline dehydrogenase family protein [unclassified Aminobacterium]MEA4877600.1 NAD/NADP octopine/nopaline dehydrogenase family protein [Aminobacterium sp.]WMI71302.1 NAD/NADP octopine/nopaline dehydrogenase family protein [Aminobacterium sp. MB27-C1]
MKFTILGSGNGARAWCAQIAAKGYPVVMWEPLEATEDYLKLREEKEMFLEGDIQVGGKLAGVTMDIKEAMDGADYILVIVPSFAHEPIFRKMIPYLEDGQNVIVVPGNFSGLRLKKMMKEAGVEKKISISETASMPYACRIDTYNTVMVYKKKFQMKMGTSPQSMNAEMLDVMNDVFKGYVEYLPAQNLLEIDFDNINYTLHPFPVLFNYGEIEKNGKTYRHYMDGITPSISEKMKELDDERMAIGAKLGLNLQTCLSQLKMYYGQNDSQSIYEYVNSEDTPYRDLVGQNVKGRYLTEDVPGVLVPISLFANKAGMETPVSDLAIRMTSFLHGTDYIEKGTTPESLGVANLSIDEIIKLIS